jgi:hypothetical protein
MELGFNLLWFLLAVASFVLIGRQEREGRRAAWRSWRHVLSLACALVIFFPIISLTDDLHAAQVATEDSNPLKRIAKCSSRAGDGSAVRSSCLPFLAAAAESPPSPPLRLLGLTSVLEIRELAAAPCDWPHLRGPPSHAPTFATSFEI